MTTDLMAAQAPPPSVDIECPYRGLRPYGEEDAEYYFGRDKERDVVIGNMMATRLTVLYGPSGVGKSSLLRAGVLRLLRQLPDTSFGYLAINRAVVAYHADWHDDPMTALGEALRAAAPSDSQLPEGPLSLELVTEITGRVDADVYLILDQFEEAFLYCGPEEIRALASELGRIVGAPGVRASVLLSLREDALAKLDSLEKHVPDLFDNMLRLDHLDAAAAREAIEQPLVRHNADRPAEAHVTIEPELVDELLVELRTGRVTNAGAGVGAPSDLGTIETPYLQLVMTRLWGEERSHGSQVLRLQTLRGLGGAAHIVRTHLDTVMATLDDDQQRVAAAVFRYLVTPSGMKVAHTAEDLAGYGGLADATILIAVMEELASGSERILRPVEPPIDRPGAPRYEIFHDVLAPAILDWQRRFSAEQERAESERQFAKQQAEAERHHERTRRRLRRSRLFSGALVLLLLAAVLAAVLAKTSSDRAEAATKLSEAAALLEVDPAGSLALAVEAHDLSGSPDSEMAVRSALEADRERLRITSPSGYRDVIAFSPDGRTFVAAGSSTSAVVHEVATGRLVREFPLAESEIVTWAGFSVDSSMVGMTTDQGRTVLYEVRTGEELLRLSDPGLGFRTRWIVRGAQQMVLRSGEGDSVEVWDVRSGELVQEFGAEVLTDYDARIEVSRDGTKAVTTRLESAADFSWVSTLSVWDTSSGELLGRTDALPGEAGDAVFLGPDSEAVFLWFRSNGGYWTPSLWTWGAETALVSSEWATSSPSVINVSTDGESAAVALDKSAGVFRFDSSEPQFSLQSQPDLLNAVSFSSSGTQVVTAGTGGQALVWEITKRNPMPLASFGGHGGEIADVRFSPVDPRVLLTAGYDGTVRLWELPLRHVVAKLNGWMSAADVSLDGTSIVSLSEYGDLSVVDAESLQEVASGWVVVADPVAFSGVQWFPDGRGIAVGALRDWAPWVWEPGGSEPPRQLDFHEGYTRGLAVNATGELVAMGATDNSGVVVWDAASGRIEHNLQAEDGNSWALDVAFIPGTTLIAAASADGTVRVWNLSEPDAQPQVLGELGAPPVTALAVAADGGWLATTSVDGSLFLYRLNEGVAARSEPGAGFERPTTPLTALAFTPDGARLVGGAVDGTVRVWDRATGQLLTVQRAHQDVVNSVSVLPDGRLVTASDDGTTVVSSCPTCGDFADILDAARVRIAAHENGSLAPSD